MVEIKKGYDSNIFKANSSTFLDTEETSFKRIKQTIYIFILYPRITIIILSL